MNNFFISIFFRSIRKYFNELAIYDFWRKFIKNFKKKIFEKYFKFHTSFFDFEINSPVALLTPLSADAGQLI